MKESVLRFPSVISDVEHKLKTNSITTNQHLSRYFSQKTVQPTLFSQN